MKIRCAATVVLLTIWTVWYRASRDSWPIRQPYADLPMNRSFTTVSMCRQCAALPDPGNLTLVQFPEFPYRIGISELARQTSSILAERLERVGVFETSAQGGMRHKKSLTLTTSLHAVFLFSGAGSYEVPIVLRAINCSSQRATGPLFRRAHLNWLP